MHSYPFSLPVSESLPSSFEGKHGYVRYLCKATIEKPWKFDHDTKTAFTVLSRLDLNYEPAELRVRRAEFEVQYVSTQPFSSLVGYVWGKGQGYFIEVMVRVSIMVRVDVRVRVMVSNLLGSG